MYLRILLTVIPFAGTHAQAESLGNLSQKLIEIRSKVNASQSRINQLEEEKVAKVRSFSLRERDISLSLQKEGINLQRLKKQLTKLKANQATPIAIEKVLRPIILENAQELKKFVLYSLPFMQKKRVENIDHLIKRIETKEIEPDVGFRELWANYEDEFHLASGSGIYKQVIQVDGEEILAEVARIGMMYFYLKTPDNKAGVARKTSTDTWEFVYFTDKQQTMLTLNLFESFRKQISTGMFELPNPQRVL